MPLNKEMTQVYLDRIGANAEAFTDDYDFVLVHDPQPAAILPFVEKAGRKSGSWIWRCHIDLSAPFRPVWEFFERIVNRYDAAIFTLPEFAQPGISGPKATVFDSSFMPTRFARQRLRLDSNSRCYVHHNLLTRIIHISR